MALQLEHFADAQVGLSNGELAYASLAAHMTSTDFQHPILGFEGVGPAPGAAVRSSPVFLQEPFPCNVHLTNFKAAWPDQASSAAAILHNVAVEPTVESSRVSADTCMPVSDGVAVGDVFAAQTAPVQMQPLSLTLQPPSATVPHEPVTTDGFLPVPQHHVRAFKLSWT